MFTKILFPTDFSDIADKAKVFIESRDPARTQEVVLLNVVNQRLIESLDTHNAIFFLDGRYKDDPDQVRQKIVDARREKLDGVARDLERLGFKVNAMVRVGNPRKEILRVESREQVSVIVMGSHGRSNLSEMLIGSVAEKVVRRSKSSVLVIKR